MAGDPLSDLEDGETAVARQYASAPGHDSAFTLAVGAGPDTGARFVVDPDAPGPLLLGTSPACALRLSDRQVSRRHAALEVDAGALRIRDLESTNGTWVQGVRVGEAFLLGGETIAIGTSLLSVERHDRQAVPSHPARGFGRFIGESPEIRRLYPLLERLALTELPVVIEGETGTGKEVLAEALHEAGPRRDAPYVVFDCTAVPANLMEAELFGHERGAFTGAVSARRGVFERAHGGTLLIDEIGDLDLALQPKLLRAIERGEVKPLGGERTVRVDVRLIAATRRDLDRAVQAGSFRDDLFHRLAVARVELPPLRRRRGDVAVLARHFWRELGGRGQPPADALARWQDDAWPGNVRELRNAVARLLAMGELGLDTEAPPSLPPPALDAPSGALDAELEQILAAKLPFPIARLRVLEAFQRRYVEQVLQASGGNIARAAEASGVARRYFQILRGGGKRKR